MHLTDRFVYKNEQRLAKALEKPSLHKDIRKNREAENKPEVIRKLLNDANNNREL